MQTQLLVLLAIYYTQVRARVAHQVYELTTTVCRPDTLTAEGPVAPVAEAVAPVTAEDPAAPVADPVAPVTAEDPVAPVADAAAPAHPVTWMLTVAESDIGVPESVGVTVAVLVACMQQQQ
jgi:hypothetical protein